MISNIPGFDYHIGIGRYEFQNAEYCIVSKNFFVHVQILPSDGSGLGLRPKPARPKPESPAGFFGPKIGQFWSRFWTEF